MRQGGVGVVPMGNLVGLLEKVSFNLGMESELG